MTTATLDKPYESATGLTSDGDGIAGDFSAGRLVDNRPESLPGWRVTSSEASVALAVAELFGQLPELVSLATDGPVEVLTDAPNVRIVLDGTDAVRTEMRLWGSRGLVHHCNGDVFLSPPAEAGAPCGCPRSMADRKALAKAGRGPQPCTTISFRLADAADLGVFRFQSASWKLAESLNWTRDELVSIGGQALCELSIQRVEVAVVGGARLAYRMPVLTALGSWE